MRKCIIAMIILFVAACAFIVYDTPNESTVSRCGCCCCTKEICYEDTD